MVKQFKISHNEDYVTVSESGGSFVNFKFKRTKEVTDLQVFQFLMDLAFYEHMNQQTILSLKDYFAYLYPNVLVNWEYASYVLHKIFQDREFEAPPHNPYRRA